MNGYRTAQILVRDSLAGYLSQTDDGYSFEYTREYVLSGKPAVSLTLPLTEKAYLSKTLFPFFDGLIPEGWLLDIAVENWKINPRDRFSLLLATCKDPIGSVSVAEVT